MKIWYWNSNELLWESFSPFDCNLEFKSSPQIKQILTIPNVLPFSVVSLPPFLMLGNSVFFPLVSLPRLTQRPVSMQPSCLLCPSLPRLTHRCSLSFDRRVRQQYAPDFPYGVCTSITAKAAQRHGRFLIGNNQAYCVFLCSCIFHHFHGFPVLLPKRQSSDSRSTDQPSNSPSDVVVTQNKRCFYQSICAILALSC